MRDPAQVFARYGRQLLTPGVQFDGQAQLHGWTVVLAHDTSELGLAAAETCGRYLVGAGVGQVVIPGQVTSPSPFGLALQALDPELKLLNSPGETLPPVAHYWFAQRPYGASVDVAVTDHAAENALYAQGLSGPARVTTLVLNLGQMGEPAHGIALGAAAADLLLADVLGLEALPATVRIDWQDPQNPQIQKQPRRTDLAPETQLQPQPGLLQEIQQNQKVWQPIVDEVQRGYPQETCGLVVREANGALKAIVCPNLQDRYHALDPVEFPRTSRTAYKMNERVIAKSADAGETLVSIWHSHCDAGAYFSAEDVRCAAPSGQALYPGVGYLVLSVLGAELRAAELYHFDAATGGFVAEPHA